MRLLVTGTEGYIGAMLAPRLMQRGHDVTGLDTGYYRTGWLYHTDTPTPRTIHADLRRLEQRDLAGYDAVVHLAELSNDPLGQHKPEITYEINHQGSVELARKAREAGVGRFVYTSSCSVYGVAGGEELKTEESEPAPQTVYARCKVLVERDVGALARDDFSPAFLRNATAYGPSPRMRFDVVINNLAGLAWTTRELKMTSDGTPWRPVVHVLDICDAIAATLEAPREAIHRQVFNVGASQENYQVRELAAIVASSFPGCTTSFGSSDGDNRSYRVAFEKLGRVLPGFRCQRTAAQGAAELAAVFERIQLSADVFRLPAFTRLKQLEWLLRTGQLDERFYWKQA